jgi:ribulose-bisphosphate carboxylase large chain
VDDIRDLGNGTFEARIGLSVATTGLEAGQLLNMLFGNSSMHPDITLADAEFPDEVLQAFGGPRHGIDGLRAMVGAGKRALTCSALKPQGLPPDGLAKIAAAMAKGGLDFIKDDHGLADQGYSRFAARVPACAEAIRRAVRSTGHPTRYIPSVTGSLDEMRAQMGVARDAGLDCAMVVPMIAGFANIQALGRDFPDMALFAHPSLGGAARIAPDLLIGKLFRMIGADAVIFPNHGGRFGYAPNTCRRLAANARADDDGMRPSLPVPAGGMTLARSSEIIDFYGPDTMLLIGGNLLSARDRITEESIAFVRAVARHPYR